MADEKQNSPWPMPRFYFSVSVGSHGAEVPFQEVSGLDLEAQAIGYRAGDTKMFTPIKMPGLMTSSTVSLRKGMLATDSAFWDWFSQIKMNTITRETVRIRLRDEQGATTMSWMLKNAFPINITNTHLKAEEKEVAVEQLDLAFETLTIENQ